MIHSGTKADRAIVRERREKRVVDHLAILGVHQFVHFSPDAFIGRDAMEAPGPGTRFEDREFSVNNNDRVDGGVENGPCGFTTLGQLNFGRDALGEVTGDEHGLGRRATVDA